MLFHNRLLKKILESTLLFMNTTRRRKYKKGPHKTILHRAAPQFVAPALKVLYVHYIN